MPTAGGNQLQLLVAGDQLQPIVARPMQSAVSPCKDGHCFSLNSFEVETSTPKSLGKNEIALHFTQHAGNSSRSCMLMFLLCTFWHSRNTAVCFSNNFQLHAESNALNWIFFYNVLRLQSCPLIVFKFHHSTQCNTFSQHFNISYHTFINLYFP